MNAPSIICDYFNSHIGNKQDKYGVQGNKGKVGKKEIGDKKLWITNLKQKEYGHGNGVVIIQFRT